MRHGSTAMAERRCTMPCLHLPAPLLLSLVVCACIAGTTGAAAVAALEKASHGIGEASSSSRAAAAVTFAPHLRIVHFVALCVAALLQISENLSLCDFPRSGTAL